MENAFARNQLYRLDIEDIDEQHRQLFAPIAELHDAMAHGTDRQIMGQVLRELLAYIHIHFTHEEALLAHYRYPELTTHKELHVWFVQHVHDRDTRFRQVNTALRREVMLLLNN
ncbi:MAG TPA: bacteriohemerythrin [Armatimonadota bacterium]|jgi:hemerythrin